MIKYTFVNSVLCVFTFISFLVQACGQNADDLKRKIQNETNISINSCQVNAQGSDTAPGDFTEYFTLQLDSLSMISVIEQIKTSEYYVDTLIQFPNFHNSFVMQDQIQFKRWTKAPFGYRYMHEKHNRGIEFIICEVDTAARTFSYRYVQD